ncbi:MAG: hypothetical protein ACT4O9_07225 [Blastocatellia bacterium]
MKELAPGFHVDLLFPDDNSDFIAEVYYKVRLVFVISQENGLNDAEVDFDEDIRGFPASMSLSGLLGAVEYARLRLSDLRKTN